MPGDLELFFRSYVSAYDAASPSMIAAHFDVPASILDGGGPQSFSVLEELERKAKSLCEHFSDIGYESAHFIAGYSAPLGDTGAYVDLEWQIDTATIVHEFRTAYILHKRPKGWRIFSAVAYEGKAESGVT